MPVPVSPVDAVGFSDHSAECSNITFASSSEDEMSASLIAEYSKGDMDAFESFYSHYHQRLAATFYNHMYALSHGHSSAWTKALDKATDILFHAYDKSETYHQGENVWEWLMSFSKLRLPGIKSFTERKKELSYSVWENDKYEPSVNGSCDSVSANTPDATHTTHDVVASILKNVDPRYVEALHLHANNNKFTKKEMGECLGGATPSMVNHLIEKGRQSFCKNLLSVIDPKTLLSATHSESSTVKDKSGQVEP